MLLLIEFEVCTSGFYLNFNNLFQLTVRAFHVKWLQLPLDNNIKKWSVHIIDLDQNRRHLDRAKLQEFWEVLDK